MRDMQEPRHFRFAAVIANVVMILVYTGTSVLAYASFGDKVSGFLPDSMADGVAKSAVGLLLMFHTAVAYLVVAQPLHRELHMLVLPATADAASSAATSHWLLITLLQLGVSMTIAITVPFFSELQALIGSLMGAPIVFGWPAFFFLRARSLHGVAVGKLDWLLCAFSLGVCLPVFLIFGTANSIRDIIGGWVAASKVKL